MAPKEDTSKRPFRVVIVGAGVVGLSLSHALQLANIDHVVLEKHSKIVSLHGAALSLFPAAARIFDQFGILEKIRAATVTTTAEYLHWPDGSIIFKSTNSIDIQKHFGIPALNIDRQKLVEYLYGGLPDKSFIRTSARVERIEQTETGATVHLTDGTTEQGDMVVGADGVHSLIRQLMWDYAASHDPSCIPDSDKKALFTAHKGIYGVSDPSALRDIGPAEVHIVLGHHVSQLLFTQPGTAMWAIVWKDEYSQLPKPFRPSEKEVEEYAKRFKDRHITPNLTFSDLWKSKSRHGCLAVEEGVLEKWHAGRIVLVGDSAHKMTADIGMGANLAIESAAVLANVLQHAVSQHSAASPFRPSVAQLSALFDEYQHQRFQRVKRMVDISGAVTRMRTYQSLWKRFFVGYIATTRFVRKVQQERMMLGFSNGPKLEYVKTRTIDEDAVGWRLAEEARRKKNVNVSGPAWVALVLATSVVGMAISYAALARYGRLV